MIARQSEEVDRV